DTKLGGIPKLMFSECRNFPEIGKFYYDEVITRSFRLVEGVLEQGMRTGEFRSVDASYATRLLLAPMVYLLLWRHSFDICDSRHVDPEKYMRQHLDMVINGLTPRGRDRGSVEPARIINIDKKGRTR
ncbi:MAG: TetR/AcrR family transcriptional regulator C-terminal domain-containing protein, partial [Burkholderiales bacterium]